MTEKLELYKCEICNNIVQVLHGGIGDLVCCGEAMEKLTPKTTESQDEMAEKHIPITEHNEDGTRVVKVGSTPHPMTEEHHIEFIEAISQDKNNVQIKFLHPENEPEMKLHIECQDPCLKSYCNLHDLWSNRND